MIVGVDIGGTKCAVATWSSRQGLHELACFPTQSPALTLVRVEQELARLRLPRKAVIGVACGGPLDAQRGVILSPPNLPGWDEVPVVARLEKSQRSRVYLMNDANANALAEWRFGAGQHSRLMVYLTAGTGMGAGIVIDGRLLEGVCGNAGEVGHIRLSPRGPVGFHKAGSFEGWCSGGGIPEIVRFLPRASQPADVAAWQARHRTTRAIAEAARSGDPVARRVFAEAGRKLGLALAGIVDLLNPDRIVIGSLYGRCRDLLDATFLPVLRREALASSLAACEIVPASLGEQTGNYGAICVGLAGIETAAGTSL
jgi:glucokinase